MVPANLTLVHLPPYSPELDPVGKVWRYLCATGTRATASWPATRLPSAPPANQAWDPVRAEPGRLRSLTRFPWLPASAVTS